MITYLIFIYIVFHISQDVCVKAKPPDSAPPPVAAANVAAPAATRQKRLAALKGALSKPSTNSIKPKINKYDKEVERARSFGMIHHSEMWDDDARISALLAIHDLQVLNHEAAH